MAKAIGESALHFLLFGAFFFRYRLASAMSWLGIFVAIRVDILF